MRAIQTVGIENVVCCDTDSIYCKDTADISKIPQADKLGDFELEDHAPFGIFAGKKLYGIKLSNPKDGKEYKIASKGSKLAYEDIKKIVKGGVIEWRNDAPSFSLDGSAMFVHRMIKATMELPQITEDF
jgi:hypothetical protein